MRHLQLAPHPLRNQHGESLIQVMVAVAILGFIIVASMTYFHNQVRATNFLEFQGKREQLRLAIIGQFLNNPDNCKCLFANSNAFPVAGTPLLTTTTPPPTILGPYKFVTPGTCAGATIPIIFVDSTGIDSVKSTAIELRDISYVSTDNYTAHFTLTLAPVKEVLGPSSISLPIPVAVQTTSPSPGTALFQSCSMTAGGSSQWMPLTVACRGFQNCHTEAMSICQAAMGPTSCLETVSCGHFDAGSQDVPIVGYKCGPQLCVDGKRARFHTIVGSQAQAQLTIPGAYSNLGVMNCMGAGTHPPVTP